MINKQNKILIFNDRFNAYQIETTDNGTQRTLRVNDAIYDIIKTRIDAAQNTDTKVKDYKEVQWGLVIASAIIALTVATGIIAMYCGSSKQTPDIILGTFICAVGGAAIGYVIGDTLIKKIARTISIQNILSDMQKKHTPRLASTAPNTKNDPTQLSTQISNIKDLESILLFPHRYKNMVEFQSLPPKTDRDCPLTGSSLGS